MAKRADRGRRTTSLGVLRIRRRPGRPSQGVLLAGRLTIPVALGRSGIKADKREGDGSTPRGIFHPKRVRWRADHQFRPRTLLPVRPIRPTDAWCEDPADRRYNRPFQRSANEPGDRLFRADALFDILIELDHNSRPRVAGRGSAVFIHVARDSFAPTAGCVALQSSDLKALLTKISARTRIVIS